MNNAGVGLAFVMILLLLNRSFCFYISNLHYPYYKYLQSFKSDFYL